MKCLIIIVLTIALLSGYQCSIADVAFGRRLSQYADGTSPRLQAQFHAMLFPLFLIGEWQTSYEYGIPFTQLRVDYLIQIKPRIHKRCIIIELKRSGSVNRAVQQAINYAQLLSLRNVCSPSWCAVGINMPQQYPRQDIEVQYSAEKKFGCQMYLDQFTKTIKDNRVTFLEIIDFAKYRGNRNDL